jgi:hypothetical protein
MLVGWQDIVATAVAAGALWLVVARTLGSWRTSDPRTSASPACDHCGIKREVDAMTTRN